jgi:hypothetical protein
LGRALLGVVVRRPVECRIDTAVIRLLKANEPTRRFYEALDGVLVSEDQIDKDGVLLEQVGYGWTDTTVLLPRREAKCISQGILHPLSTDYRLWGGACYNGPTSAIRYSHLSVRSILMVGATHL